MTTTERVVWIARTDATFALRNGHWIGRCLICDGPPRVERERRWRVPQSPPDSSAVMEA